MDSEYDRLRKTILLNPRFAEDLHMDLVNALTKDIENYEQFYTFALIRDLPTFFSDWEKKVVQLPLQKKIKMLNLYTKCITTALTSEALLSYDPLKIELSTQLDYWQMELDKLIPKKKSNKSSLSLKQIALIHAYEQWQITRNNADEIAGKYGYNSPKSGEKLYQDYLKFCRKTDRKGGTASKKTMSNKIELFESITNNLTDPAKQRAEDEIEILKTLFKSEYQ